MSYATQELRYPCAEVGAIARFLADFVKDGELPSADVNEERQEVWEQRLEKWWAANPFCHSGSLIGLTLKNSEGELVGFHGFIPHDYIASGKIVPGLIATTFFVRSAHRQAALGILMRVKRLSARFHIIDGSPSAEMRVLLERFNFTKSSTGSQHYRIVGGRKSLSPKTLVLNLAARSLSGPRVRSIEPHRLVRSPKEIVSIAEPSDSMLRKRVTKEGLAWLLNATSSKKIFLGLCDAKGELRAYFVGVPKSKFGIHSLRVVEACSFDADGSSLTCLLNLAATTALAGLSAKTDLLILSTLDSNARRLPGWPIARKWHSHLYFQVPAFLADADKLCQPSEGDALLL